MARYTGPVCRLCRRYGDKLYLKGDRCSGPKCAFERRPNPPGQQKRFGMRRRRVSDRALQLREKQRARFTYGIMEGQFRRYYKQAVRRAGVTGETLVRLLEQRSLSARLRRFALAGAPSRSARSHLAQWTYHGYPILRDESRR